VQYRHSSPRSCTFYIYPVPGVFRENFSGIFAFVPHFFWPYTFQPENFWDFQISRQFFFHFSTFDRNFFGIFKFRTEKKFPETQEHGSFSPD